MNKEALTTPALEALLQAPSLAILAVDKQGCVILWSPSASRMFGWTESEVLGRFLPIVTEEHRQEVYDRIQAELKGEITSALDVRRLRKDGSLVDVSLWTAPLRDSKGEVIGILGLYADVTARKRAEEALRQTEAELRRVLAAVSDYLYSGEFDSDGRFFYHYYSPAVERIMGRPPEFFLAGPERWLGAVHSEDRPRLAQAFARWQSGQSASEEEEYRVVLPDGAIRWVRDSVVISQGTDGRRFVNGVVSDITARKQTEEALKESEERFRQVAENAGEFIWEVDAKGLYTYASPPVKKLLGYTPEELVGKKHFYDLFVPSVRDELKAAAFQVFADRQTFRDFPNANVSKSGEIMHLETSGTPVLDSAGNLVGYRGADTDVTARRQAQEVLRESEERYRLIVEAIPHPAWRANAQGALTEFNGRWYEYTGQTREEAGGNGWMKALHPDDVGRVMQEVEDSVAAGRIYQAEYRLRRAADGSYRWHLARSLPIKDKDGRVVCRVGSAVDIDDQKRVQDMLEERVRERTAELVEANAALRNSEAKYRTLVEEIPAITYIAALDEASTTLYVSPQVEPLLGLTLADWKANPHTIWHERLHRDDRERVLAELRRTHACGELFDCEYRMLNHAGEPVWFRDRAVVVRDEAGRPLFLQGVMLDVTEHKRADEALRELETRFRTVFDGAADGMFVVDLESRKFVICNAACSRMLGFTPEEFRNLDIADLHLPEDLPFISEQIGKFAKGEQGTRHDIRFKRRDGSTFFTDLNPTLITLGGRKGILIVFRDITERKQAEESQRHLAAIVESSDDAIISTDLDGIITSWNAAAQRLYNYAPEEILGRSFRILTPPNRRAEASENLKKVQCGEHIQQFETVRLRKGGVPVEVSITVSPTKNDAGQVIGGSVITRDITERKRAQEALQKSEAQYRALVETTDTGFVILDRAGRVLDANVEYVRLTGHRDLDEIRGRSVVEWTAGPDKERNAESVRACLKNGYIRNLEIGYVDSHGKVTPVEVNATAEKSRGMLRIVSLCRDISERKELEQAIVEASSREQRRIGQDLHDGLCQQLTGIGFLWKAVAQRAAARALPKAAEVAEISQLITKAISEARALSRALCPVELESNDLGVVLKNLGLSMERLYAVSCVVRCQQPVLLADKTVATHLYRIAQEAISNAIRHGKAARVWIHLIWRKNGLTLRIRDNGSGFSKRRGFKEGIGMRSMKYRAQVIGGSLAIESKRGAGTTVACVGVQPRSRSAGEVRRHTPG